ncbi:SafA/ExsA family spore coat assembly protein, partial [Peribacillus kribbensis]|uniref:SafA/ExsA family spore coat assembly protein n=1 Tax=Peribacillus kribbensis TaxID=356658 RepID=UPI000685ED26
MKIHIAKKGDTLWILSKKYNVNFDELKKLNSQLSNPDMIMPGMKIKIPGDAKSGGGTGTGAKITYSAKETPKSTGPLIKEKAKEVPVSPAPVQKAPPQPPPVKEMPVPVPQAPPVVSQATQPEITEVEINNYFTANMANMTVPEPKPAPVIPKKPANVLPGLMKQESPESPESPEPPPQPQMMQQAAPVMEQQPPVQAAPMLPPADQCIPISPVMPGTGYFDPINMPNYPFPAAPMFPQMPGYPQQQGAMPQVQGAYMQQPYMHHESSSYDSSSYIHHSMGGQPQPYSQGYQMPFAPQGGVMGGFMGHSESSSSPYESSSNMPKHSMYYGHLMHSGGVNPQAAPSQVMGQYAPPADDCGCGAPQQAMPYESNPYGQQAMPYNPAYPSYGVESPGYQPPQAAQPSYGGDIQAGYGQPPQGGGMNQPGYGQPPYGG